MFDNEEEYFLKQRMLRDDPRALIQLELERDREEIMRECYEGGSNYHDSCVNESEKEKELIAKKEKEEFVNSAIGLSEIAIKKHIPNDIIGEICSFFPAADKSELSRRKTGQKIHRRMIKLEKIKKRVMKCENLEDFKNKYEDEQYTESDYKIIKKLFGKSFCSCLIL